MKASKDIIVQNNNLHGFLQSPFLVQEQNREHFIKRVLQRQVFRLQLVQFLQISVNLSSIFDSTLSGHSS